MKSREYKEDREDRKIWGGVWTASSRFSTAAGTNEDNYLSNNINLSEGMGGKDKCLCLCVWEGGECVPACMDGCAHASPSISLVVSPSFPESQYLFVSPQ